MKKALFLFVLASMVLSCKTDTKKAVEDTLLDTQEDAANNKLAIEYPANIAKVFEAHGGLENWNNMNNLCFEFLGRGGVETHTVSLKDRRSKIVADKWTVGFDGQQVWLLENEPEVYKGNARFYHNLMFYFYAMPFVLADDGINYTAVGATQLDGQSYYGVKVSYLDGVGDSPKDEYILFFDPETHQMEWLGYTVTYRNNEKSDKWNYIKYGEWQTVNGLVLPKALTWYNVEDSKPTNARNTMQFDKIVVTETVLDDSVFAKPKDAVISER